ncbi:conserved protein of unknown function [Pseudomonas marincola]|uniref:Uncharacterized protein n=1 Tax=Pseudomonas marincola TaxID=437900 RepID=A0A653E974_9PSED|nr:conserved protein of unknown function [Pseudomonas marincola]
MPLIHLCSSDVMYAASRPTASTLFQRLFEQSYCGLEKLNIIQSFTFPAISVFQAEHVHASNVS